MPRALPETRRTPSHWRALLPVLAAALLALLPGARPVSGVGHAPEAAAHGAAAIAPGGILFHLAAPGESLAPVAGGGAPGATKDRSGSAAGLAHAAGCLVRTAAVRQAGTVRDALVALRRCALLFPFHFFW